MAAGQDKVFTLMLMTVVSHGPEGISRAELKRIHTEMDEVIAVMVPEKNVLKQARKTEIKRTVNGSTLRGLRKGIAAALVTGMRV